jgi:hypothetical protein
MRAILHIVTKANDVLAADVIAKQRTRSELAVKVVDLTVRDPDYQSLLAEIFATDSIQVW